MDAIINIKSTTLAEVSAIANDFAMVDLLNDYTMGLSKSTRITHKNALAKFCSFLAVVGVDLDADRLMGNIASWQGLTWGIVEAFKKWSLKDGHAHGSINLRLSIIKTYASIACQSKIISEADFKMIQLVKGYTQRNKQMNIDENRDKSRVGHKKAKANTLTTDQMTSLLECVDQSTLIGKRDYLLMSILFRHGLRVSEVAILTTDNFKNNQMRFYRPKVVRTDTHALYEETKQAYHAYLDALPFAPDGYLLASGKRQGLADKAMSVRSMQDRVKLYGQKIGIGNLSPHDARHSLATWHAQSGKNATQLTSFFGWSSLLTAQRYVKLSTVGNQGVSTW